jgi:hypothetical protein
MNPKTRLSFTDHHSLFSRLQLVMPAAPPTAQYKTPFREKVSQISGRHASWHSLQFKQNSLSLFAVLHGAPCAIGISDCVVYNCISCVG